MTGPSRLERLPLHILEAICEYLGHGDRAQRSLVAFSLASRYCAEAAASQLYARFYLQVRNKEKLRVDLDRYIALLTIGNRFRHVRQVIVYGSMLDEADPKPTRYVYATKWDLALDLNPESDSDSEDESERIDKQGHRRQRQAARYSVEYRSEAAAYHLTPQYKQTHNESWQPLAEFIGQLPGLKDMMFTCDHPMPSCLLKALHQHHPRSRLHVYDFDLRSLYQDPDNLHDIDPDEFALITSPCLHTIEVNYTHSCPDGRHSFNAEAVTRMVARYAPGLRRVCMLEAALMWETRWAWMRRGPKPQWLGFFLEEPEDTSSADAAPMRSKGRLEELLLGSRWLSPSEVDEWHRCTDLTYLRLLEIQNQQRREALDLLISLAETNHFKALRELHFDVNVSSFPDKTASLFLQALPPLQVITLTQWFGKRTFEAVVHRHGPALRKLYMRNGEPGRFILTYQRARQIAQHCPKLEDLEMSVTRSLGGPEEVSVYRSLGRLPRLRRLTLNLEPTPAYRGDDDEDESEQEEEEQRQKKQGEAQWESKALDQRNRELLINLAIDETLALSIFRTIAAATAPRPSRLQRLRLRVVYGAWDNLPDDMLQEEYHWEMDLLTRWLSRNWVVKRNVRSGFERGDGDEDGDGVVAKEVGMDDSRMAQILEHLDEDMLEELGFLEIWNEFWPSSGEGDWREDWKSFPLEERGVDDDES